MDLTYQLSPKPSSSLAMKCPLGKMECHAVWRFLKMTKVKSHTRLSGQGKRHVLLLSNLCAKVAPSCPSIASVWVSALWLHTQHQQCRPWWPPFLPRPLMSASWLCLLWPRQTPVSLAAFDGIFVFLYVPFVLNCAQRKLVELSLLGGW